MNGLFYLPLIPITLLGIIIVGAVIPYLIVTRQTGLELGSNVVAVK